MIAPKSRQGCFELGFGPAAENNKRNRKQEIKIEKQNKRHKREDKK